MSHFDMNKLVVLHLYNYVKPKGEIDPLSQVEKECQVVKVSTCMRTIYILSSDALTSDKQSKAYQALITFLNKKDHYSGATIFARLEGKEAYSFLLYWMIGGVNPKRLFDDSRIIGDVRKIWNKMSVSPSPRAQVLVDLYRQLFISLFTDSTKLAGLIKLYYGVDRAESSRQLKLACENCTWAREKGFLNMISAFNYQYFAENTHLAHMKESLELSQKKLLDKAEFSPSGEVCFFKSNYEMSVQNLNAITNRLKAISDLLQLMDSELEDTGYEAIVTQS
jgi:Holliday junction resolvase-like predicted endonuclease